MIPWKRHNVQYWLLTYGRWSPWVVRLSARTSRQGPENSMHQMQYSNWGEQHKKVWQSLWGLVCAKPLSFHIVVYPPRRRVSMWLLHGSADIIGKSQDQRAGTQALTWVSQIQRLANSTMARERSHLHGLRIYFGILRMSVWNFGSPRSVNDLIIVPARFLFFLWFRVTGRQKNRRWLSRRGGWELQIGLLVATTVVSVPQCERTPGKLDATHRTAQSTNRCDLDIPGLSEVQRQLKEHPFPILLMTEG